MKAKYFRQGSKITNIETGDATVYASITVAKRASRELQMKECGALGRGILFVQS